MRPRRFPDDEANRCVPAGRRPARRPGARRRDDVPGDGPRCPRDQGGGYHQEGAGWRHGRARQDGVEAPGHGEEARDPPSWAQASCHRHEAAGRIAYHWGSYYRRLDGWLATTRARAAKWGFNTAGASSLPPDVLALPVIPDLELGRTARFHWVDPFHPATEERMRAAARRLVAPYKGSPFRIGYFSDNEVGWWNGALFAFYLERAATNHTKQRLVALLREVYGDDWDRFARDFVPPPGVASFADLLAREGVTPHLRPGGDGIQVVRRWTGMVAERYYRLVHH